MATWGCTWPTKFQVDRKVRRTLKLCRPGEAQAHTVTDESCAEAKVNLKTRAIPKPASGYKHIKER